MKEAKKILVIGKKGVGKATLIKLLSNNNQKKVKDEKEVISVSETMKVEETKISTDNGKEYSIVDTPSFSKENKDEWLKLMKENYNSKIKGNLVRVFFLVDDSTPNEIEREIYAKLPEIFEGQAIYDCVTIIRTKFSETTGIAVNEKNIEDEYSKIAGGHRPHKIIHVSAEESDKVKLKEHLGVYCNDFYRPEGLDTKENPQSSSDIKKGVQSVSNDPQAKRKKELINQVEKLADDLKDYSKSKFTLKSKSEESKLFDSLESKTKDWKKQINKITADSQFQKVLSEICNYFSNSLDSYQIKWPASGLDYKDELQKKIVESGCDIGEEIKQVITRIDQRKIEKIYDEVKKEVGIDDKFFVKLDTSTFENFEGGKEPLITSIVKTFESFREQGEGLEIKWEGLKGHQKAKDFSSYIEKKMKDKGFENLKTTVKELVDEIKEKRGSKSTVPEERKEINEKIKKWIREELKNVMDVRESDGKFSEFSNKLLTSRGRLGDAKEWEDYIEKDTGIQRGQRDRKKEEVIGKFEGLKKELEEFHKLFRSQSDKTSVISDNLINNYYLIVSPNKNIFLTGEKAGQIYDKGWMTLEDIRIDNYGEIEAKLNNTFVGIGNVSDISQVKTRKTMLAKQNKQTGGSAESSVPRETDPLLGRNGDVEAGHSESSPQALTEINNKHRVALVTAVGTIVVGLVTSIATIFKK